MIDDPLPVEVAPQERISRYIFLEGQFNASKKRVRPGAFKPREPLPGKARTYSVYRTQDCTETEVWALSDTYVAKLEGPKALARADLAAEQIIEQELTLIPLTTPHPRHTDIANWPDQPELIEMKAVELAKRARLVTRD